MREVSTWAHLKKVVSCDLLYRSIGPSTQSLISPTQHMSIHERFSRILYTITIYLIMRAALYRRGCFFHLKSGEL